MAVDKLIRRSGLTHQIAVQGTGLETTGIVDWRPEPRRNPHRGHQ